MRRSPMHVSIEDILTAAGRLDDFNHALANPAQGFHLRLEKENYMPLVIEVTALNEVSVAHYFTQNGDAMRDPEIVFLAHPVRSWLPVEITQDPVGIFRRAPEGRYLRSVQELAKAFAMNLRWQGWAKVAADQAARRTTATTEAVQS